MTDALYPLNVATIDNNQSTKLVGASSLAMLLLLPAFASKLAPTKSSRGAQHLTRTWP